MTFEIFCEKFDNLSDEMKIEIYRNYLSEVGEEGIYPFDEEFFDMCFSCSPMDAARAVYFGNIDSWSDSYIRFNAYGNLESLSEYEVLGEIDDHMEDIYKNSFLWCDYIEEDGDEEEE